MKYTEARKKFRLKLTIATIVIHQARIQTKCRVLWFQHCSPNDTLKNNLDMPKHEKQYNYKFK